MTVAYEFDRTHEGMDDVYWSGSQPNGFQLGFDKDQVLYVVFLYIAASEGFDPIDPEEVDFSMYGSFDEAKASFDSQGLSYKVSPGEKWWIKGDFDGFTRHYQFRGGNLHRITLSLKREA